MPHAEKDLGGQGRCLLRFGKRASLGKGTYNTNVLQLHGEGREALSHQKEDEPRSLCRINILPLLRESRGRGKVDWAGRITIGSFLIQGPPKIVEEGSGKEGEPGVEKGEGKESATGETGKIREGMNRETASRETRKLFKTSRPPGVPALALGKRGDKRKREMPENTIQKGGGH